MAGEQRGGSSWKSGDLGVPVLGRDTSGNYDVLELGALTPEPFAASDTGSATNGTVTLTWAAQTDLAHVLAGLWWSFSATPTTLPATLQVTDGSTVVYNLDIIAGGPGEIVFQPPRQGTPGQSLTVTLSAGGTGIVGKLNAEHWTRGNRTVGGLDFSNLQNSGYLPIL